MKTEQREPTGASQPLHEKNVLRVEELASYLGIGRTSAYALIRNGNMPSFTIGKSRRVRRSDADRYVDQQIASER